MRVVLIFEGRGKALLRRCSKGKARPLVTAATDGGKGGDGRGTMAGNRPLATAGREAAREGAQEQP